VLEITTSGQMNALDEERHYEQYDNEVVNIEKFGERYLALQSIEGSKKAATETAG